jgi:CCR4-NOT transcription complex subunit 6
MQEDSKVTDSKSTLSKELTIVQWNTLAQSLCHSLSFPFVNKNVLEWPHRFKQMMKRLNDFKADIICLEEVDKDCFLNDFEPALNALGYDGIYCKKVSNDNKDGCAIFVKRSTVKLHQWKSVRLLSTQSQVALLADISPVADLLCRTTIVCTHLKAKPGFEDIRLQQVKALSIHIQSFSKSLNIVVCGDFNDEPTSLMYGYMCDHLLSQPNPLVLQSVYDKLYGQSFFTTAKKRQSTVVRTIDYIWTSNTLNITKLAPLPTLTDLPKLLPSIEYPSDHLPLCITFTYAK